MDTSFLILAALEIIIIVLLVVLLFQGRRRGSSELASSFASIDKSLEKTERMVREEIARSREENGNNARRLRDEVNNSLKMLGDSLTARLNQNATLQIKQLDAFSSQINDLTRSNEQKLEQMRNTVEEKLIRLQKDNNDKLEQMRATVDEKLHETLEKRLDGSFKRVSESLEEVHKGLGEMKILAAGVGDLKKVLTNVKTRGVWGEISLAGLLEQILTSEQYGKNVATKKAAVSG
jgi:DNA recombination protein RmuC